MPEYIFDLEKSFDFQRNLSEELLNVCKTTNCEYCGCRLLCTFNINVTTQLYLLRQK